MSDFTLPLPAKRKGGILKKDDNNTVIGVMPLRSNTATLDNTQSRLFARPKRRVSFAPEATMTTFENLSPLRRNVPFPKKDSATVAGPSFATGGFSKPGFNATVPSFKSFHRSADSSSDSDSDGMDMTNEQRAPVSAAEAAKLQFTPQKSPAGVFKAPGLPASAAPPKQSPNPRQSLSTIFGNFRPSTSFQDDGMDFTGPVGVPSSTNDTHNHTQDMSFTQMGDVRVTTIGGNGPDASQTSFKDLFNRSIGRKDDGETSKARDSMGMDFTQTRGGLKEPSASSSKARDSLGKARESIGRARDSWGMDMTVPLGSIKPRFSGLANDLAKLRGTKPRDSMTMEFTQVGGSLRPRDSLGMDLTDISIRRESGGMDFTQVRGGLRAGDVSVAMDFTQLTGRIGGAGRARDSLAMDMTEVGGGIRDSDRIVPVESPKEKDNGPEDDTDMQFTRPLGKIVKEEDGMDFTNVPTGAGAGGAGSESDDGMEYTNVRLADTMDFTNVGGAVDSGAMVAEDDGMDFTNVRGFATGARLGEENLGAAVDEGMDFTNVPRVSSADKGDIMDFTNVPKASHAPASDMIDQDGMDFTNVGGGDFGYSTRANALKRKSGVMDSPEGHQSKRRSKGAAVLDQTMDFTNILDASQLRSFSGMDMTEPRVTAESGYDQILSGIRHDMAESDMDFTEMNFTGHFESSTKYNRKAVEMEESEEVDGEEQLEEEGMEERADEDVDKPLEQPPSDAGLEGAVGPASVGEDPNGGQTHSNHHNTRRDSIEPSGSSEPPFWPAQGLSTIQEEDTPEEMTHHRPLSTIAEDEDSSADRSGLRRMGMATTPARNATIGTQATPGKARIIASPRARTPGRLGQGRTPVRGATTPVRATPGGATPVRATNTPARLSATPRTIPTPVPVSYQAPEPLVSTAAAAANSSPVASPVASKTTPNATPDRSRKTPKTPKSVRTGPPSARPRGIDVSPSRSSHTPKRPFSEISTHETPESSPEPTSASPVSLRHRFEMLTPRKGAIRASAPPKPPISALSAFTPMRRPPVTSSGDELTMSRFLQLIDMQFMDAFLFAEKNHRPAVSQVSESDYVVNSFLSPNLELFKWGVDHLRKDIDTRSASFAELDEETLRDVPPIFVDYTSADPSVKLLLNKQFAVDKQYYRVVARKAWYDWRKEITADLGKKLTGNRNALKADLEVVEAEFQEVDQEVAAMEKELEAVQEELVRLQNANTDVESKLGLSSEIRTVQQSLAPLVSQLEEANATASQLEGSLNAEISLQRSISENISEAHKVIQANQQIEMGDIEKLQERLRRVQQRTGLRVGRFVSGEVAEFHSSELTFAVDKTRKVSGVRPAKKLEGLRLQAVSLLPKGLSLNDTLAKWSNVCNFFAQLEEIQLGFNTSCAVVDGVFELKLKLLFNNAKDRTDVTVAFPFSSIIEYPQLQIDFKVKTVYGRIVPLVVSDFATLVDEVMGVLEVAV